MSRGLFAWVSTLLQVWLLLPLAAIVYASVATDAVPVFPPTGITLHWYAAAYDVGSFRRGLEISLIVACLSTVLAMPVGLTAALALARWQSPWRAPIETALMAPIFVPGLVIGIALMMAVAASGLDIGFGRLILGHTLMIFPYIARTTYASLAVQDASLEEAARTMGAGEFRIVWSVQLPLARPGIVAGTIFAFIMSFDDVPVALFLADARTTTLPLAVLSYLEYNFDPAVAAVSAAQVIFTFFAAVLLERLFGLKRLWGAGNG
ncbi:MAG: ABC transporter permease [Alphaproteobacteria bacterium]|nr:ABC transporter permease [Alphaproteobacteria bacterium]